MKILVFNWRCWLNPEMGGAEVFTHEATRRWADVGHEVTLFTSTFPGCEKEETLDGVRVVRSGSRFSVYWEAKKFYSKRFKSECFDLIVDEINTRPFFAHSFIENGEHVVALIHQLAREYWFYEASFPLNVLGYYYFENKWLRKYANVPTVTVSNSTREDLAALGFKQVFVIPEGLDFEPLAKLSPKKNHPVIVYAGRLKKAKRPIHAIRAFEKVKEKLPDAELWIIGDGPVRRKLEGMSVQGTRFYGRLDDSERRRLIEQSWVLVNPGVREGWGLNTIEANALGVPCVAYSVPGLKDSVQDYRTGFLVKNGDVQALADGLLTLLTDEELRVRFSRNALEYSCNFSWDVTACEFLRIAMSTTHK
ncbi:MAG: glycosyltransferase family 4 protein [Candidatus Bathyarchaeia archaeon]